MSAAISVTLVKSPDLSEFHWPCLYKVNILTTSLVRWRNNTVFNLTEIIQCLNQLTQRRWLVYSTYFLFPTSRKKPHVFVCPLIKINRGWGIEGDYKLESRRKEKEGRKEGKKKKRFNELIFRTEEKKHLHSLIEQISYTWLNFDICAEQWSYHVNQTVVGFVGWPYIPVWLGRF